MVSLLRKKWLSEMLPVVSTLSLEQFIGVSDLNLRTANNASLSIESVALIDFAFKPNTEQIKVQFLITSESMEDPIFGYNLIEHLVTSTNEKVAVVPDLLEDMKVIKRKSSPVTVL